MKNAQLAVTLKKQQLNQYAPMRRKSPKLKVNLLVWCRSLKVALLSVWAIALYRSRTANLITIWLAVQVSPLKGCK